jgi:hypothetical protein
MPVRYALPVRLVLLRAKVTPQDSNCRTKWADNSFDAREQKSVSINFDHRVNFPCGVRRLTLSSVALTL